MPYTNAHAFVQALFGEFSTKALFSNSVDGPRTPDWKSLDTKLDCYYSIGEYQPEAKSNLRELSLGVRVLVIDDVVERIPAELVLLALGTPTAIVQSSAGSQQWVYRLSELISVWAWPRVLQAVDALIGHTRKTNARSSVQLFRLPIGRNTKAERNNYEVHLVEFNPEIEIDTAWLLGLIPGVNTVESTFHPDQLTYEEAAELMDMVPNADVDRSEYIDVGHRLKARCPEGEPIWEEWAAKSKKDGTKGTGDKWDTFGSNATNGWLLDDAARKAEPERYAAWRAKWWEKRRTGEAKEAFDDGEIEPGPLVVKAKAVPHMLLSGEFVAGFVPPDYLIEKLITKAFLYSLTGQTGAGKTSITLRLAATVALGRSFGGLETTPCRVLYMAAENPVDIQMRWIALADEMGFDVDKIPVIFIKDRFRIGATLKELRAEAERVGGEFGLVIVDTGPVFFEGEDENDRVAMRKHAEMMRKLIDVIPGKPAVIVNMHPTKNATASDLTPAGGGSFLNEVDGNLTAAKSEESIELGWQGKWRGVEFAPLDFILKIVTHPKLTDSKGNLMPTVVCDHLSSDAKEIMEQAAADDDEKLIAEIARTPRASQSELAVHMGWFYATGKPNKSKVKRRVAALTKQKRIKQGMPKSKLNGSHAPEQIGAEHRSGAPGADAPKSY